MITPPRSGRSTPIPASPLDRFDVMAAIEAMPKEQKAIVAFGVGGVLFFFILLLVL